MPGNLADEPYRRLARYYDGFFSALRSPIDAARDQMLRGLWPQVKTACDLACGTGSTALRLARKGIGIYAVDRSPAMCSLARENTGRSRRPIQVLQGDMRSFRLPQPVDLITCEGDALNHLPRKADLRLVARAVHRALRPGGYFFTDVNNARGFARYWSGTAWLEQPGAVLVMRNGHSPRADRAWSHFDLFVREGSAWQRHEDRVEEVCWSRAEIRRVFREAGFDRLRALDAAPFFPKDSLIGPGCRTFYLARKAPGSA